MYQRRDILKAMSATAGGIALSPFLQHMKLHADGNPDNLPKRFVFVMKENGLRPYGIQPQGYEDAPQRHGTKKYNELDLKDLKLAPSMSELKPLKDHVNIIQGLSSRICSGNHGFNFGTLGVYPGGKNRAMAETIDGALSKFFPAAFSHMGFFTKPGGMITYPKISALGKDKNLPFFSSPALAYKSLFGLVSDDKNVQIDSQLDSKLLDFLIGDIKRVKKTLNAVEKEKLDHYLSGYEAIVDRRIKMSKISNLKKHAPIVDNKYTSNVETHQQEAQFDLATAALITGLTNVVTIKTDDLGLTYSGLGHKMNTHHVGHLSENGSSGKSGFDGSKNQGISTGRQMRHDIRAYHFKLIANMAKKLKAIPEGDGTMLDNTLIVYLSFSGARHHPANKNNFPFVTVGNINNKFKTGKYIHYPAPNVQGHRTFAGLYNSILHAAGKPRNHFGHKDPNLNLQSQDGPLAELIA